MLLLLLLLLLMSIIIVSQVKNLQERFTKITKMQNKNR